MMLERVFEVDHSTLNRWVFFYTPKILEKLRWHWKTRAGHNWRVDETYVKVKGKWAYLYKAIDNHGNAIDFLFLQPETSQRQSVS